MGQTRYSLLESTGDVRTQGDFQKVSVTTGTDTRVVDATSLMVALVPGVTVNSTAGDSDNIKTWVQPANTLITQIDVWCALAPTIATGDIGWEVGTSSGAGQIVLAASDQLVNNGTTVVINAVGQTTLVQVTQSQTTFAISAQWTDVARDIFCNITNVGNASTAGSFTFVISYINLDTTAA